MSNFLGGISGSFQAFCLAGSLALGLSSGCVLQRGGLGSPSDGNTDGEGGALSEGGMPDGGMDSGILPMGPTLQQPASAQVLTPARAYFLWQDGPIPSGLTVSGYELCTTTGPMTEIDENSECPNSTMVSARHHAINPLSAGATYLWKVRTRFNDGSFSAYSGIQNFVTDHSLVDWLPFNEGSGTTASDSSGSGNNGTLQNSQMWTPGRVGQALQFGGTSDVLVADA